MRLKRCRGANETAQCAVRENCLRYDPAASPEDAAMVSRPVGQWGCFYFVTAGDLDTGRPIRGEAVADAAR